MYKHPKLRQEPKKRHEMFNGAWTGLFLLECPICLEFFTEADMRWRRVKKGELSACRCKTCANREHCYNFRKKRPDYHRGQERKRYQDPKISAKKREKQAQRYAAKKPK